MPNYCVSVGEFLTSPVEYKYHVLGIIVLHEVQLDNKYILLDVLVCSIAVYFYESCSILARQNTNDEYKFTTILHAKMSNKRFIIQRFRSPKILTCQGF